VRASKSIQELLAQKTETRNLDCKASFSWDTADYDAKCELVKDILAFLNTQDGGQIVVSVQDDAALLPSVPLEPSPAGIELVGLQLGESVAAAGTAAED